MNILTAKISALTLILMMAFGSQAKAEKDSVIPDKKETISVVLHAPMIKFISDNFELSINDFRTLSRQLNKIKGLSVQCCEQELEYIEEDCQSEQLENWMFEELTTGEKEPAMEGWMFDTEYFDN